METKEINDLEYIKRLTDGYLNTLKSINNKTDLYTAEIKLRNYYELGCLISSMLKLCVLALNQDELKISETDKKSPINVNVILEVVLQLFPLDEFELLSEINQVLISNNPDSSCK
ncbi:hypothetical protein [Flavobacterium hydatis]|uniref:Uncharacterized protein n=1 Tax=Flavobacterium hydatis TaxID=991 RepID=A0A086AQ69_FLAHY|nr:hypothetical protein [Flavobacterium hydatis]KFF18833.1 hypothetical protein IW20_04505 [Flavobacterium hydatis]OXA88752.1 hypothetical protein B0A62_21135 [Flavobacterium hydatis]